MEYDVFRIKCIYLEKKYMVKLYRKWEMVEGNKVSVRERKKGCIVKQHVPVLSAFFRSYIFPLSHHF